jgi:hypothetical protein
MPKTEREIRAIAYGLADEIETKAQPLIDAGLSRDKAIALTIAQLSGHLIITRG